MTEQTENKPEISLRDQVVQALQSCYDPEIPVNVYDLGLIYGIDINESNEIRIDMTLTSPNCPSIEALPEEIREKVASIDGVAKVDINLIWEPPFTVDMMSDEAKLALGLL